MRPKAFPGVHGLFFSVVEKTCLSLWGLAHAWEIPLWIAACVFGKTIGNAEKVPGCVNFKTSFKTKWVDYLAV